MKRRLLFILCMPLLAGCSIGTSADLDVGTQEAEPDVQIEGEAGVYME